MGKVILTRGIQGSGKSTWAKAWTLEDPKTRVRICYDDLRLMMGGGQAGYWVPGPREKILGDLQETLIRGAIREGFDVVVDNMNLNPKILPAISELLKDTGYSVEYKDFLDVPLEECIRRDSLRERPIGESVIRATYWRYKDIINEELGIL